MDFIEGDITSEIESMNMESIDEKSFQELLNTLTYGEYEEINPLSPSTDVEDYENLYQGQWQKIEQLSLSGSNTVKTSINRLWWNMASMSPDMLFLRKTFSNFFETKCWKQLNLAEGENSTSARMASTIMTMLLVEVEDMMTKLKNNQNLSIGALPQNFQSQLQLWMDHLQNSRGRPMVIVSDMQEIINEEIQILDFAKRESNGEGGSWMQSPNAHSNSVPSPGNATDPVLRINEISNRIAEIESDTQTFAGKISNLEQSVGQLRVSTGDQVHAISQIDISQLDQIQQQRCADLRGRRDAIIAEERRLIEQHLRHCEALRAVKTSVVDVELVKWKRNQAYDINGMNMKYHCQIFNLESWFKQLAKLVNLSMQQVMRLRWIVSLLEPEQQQQPGTQGPVAGQSPSAYVDTLWQQYSLMLQEIVRKGLVVVEQPPQVMMKDKRFCCKLRHLVSDGLDIHQVMFEVEASLVNGEQASKVLQEEAKGVISNFSATGKIVNNTARCDYSDHQLTVTMRTMCLKIEQRQVNRNSEMVAELKFAMLFRTTIPVRLGPNSQANVVAQTMSLPIVVISHGKQEAAAQATILWDNAFSKIGRNPFEVDDAVPWSLMMETLNCRWKKHCGSLGLDQSCQKYLTNKLFNEPEVPNSTMITWRKFNSEKIFGNTQLLKKESFTFWTWFYKAMELASNKVLRTYWNQGLIHGFVGKNECQKMLLEQRIPGVFLFRFSETRLGALSISCIRHSASKQLEVHHLTPDSIKEFAQRRLPDMVKDLEYLHFLYPKQPKDHVFGRYYSRTDTESDPDYTPKILICSTTPNSSSVEPQSMLSSTSSGYPNDTDGEESKGRVLMAIS